MSENNFFWQVIELDLILLSLTTHPDVFLAAIPVFDSSAAAIAADVDQLLKPMSELEPWTDGRVTDDTTPEDASWASARSLDTNFPDLVVRVDSSTRGFDKPPGSGSRLRGADGGRTGDIGGVFHAARTSSGG